MGAAHSILRAPRDIVYGIISARGDLQRSSVSEHPEAETGDPQPPVAAPWTSRCAQLSFRGLPSFILSGWLPKTFKFVIQSCRRREQYSGADTSRGCWGARHRAPVS